MNGTESTTEAPKGAEPVNFLSYIHVEVPADAELEVAAIIDVAAALNGLGAEAAGRVLDWARARFVTSPPTTSNIRTAWYPMSQEAADAQP